MFIQCKLRLRTEETNAIYPFRIEEDPGCSGRNATGLRNRTAHLTESEWCGVRYRVLREVRGNFRVCCIGWGVRAQDGHSVERCCQSWFCTAV